MEKYPESIDPDTEQILFEKLSMNDEDYKDLEYIRRSMKALLRHENKIMTDILKKNLNTV